MSIKIDVNKCVSCGKCIEVCPGSLLLKNENGKAFIRYPKNCWGCTACLKECKLGAIKYYLGADIGGNGSTMYVTQNGESLEWRLESKDGRKVVITTNSKEANKY
ncbi:MULTISPECIES: 4Fe-4S dicluster domain-containing protein [Clostridium]|uniref:4Fe-4S dicluster domain-containing protein n=1 Tax=Clostridium TaxID=1485 RepID=UPI00069F99D1|nr:MULTISPECIES: ferredoxin family protein [Clostridium]KOF57683.1 adenylylsulfate reductase [Clostridium sp. DMHC 10]MCD2347037.1 ferredoxin family protein [Clostridium guangxiense]